MKTHYTEEELIGYLESGKRDKEIAAHLVDCAECRKVADELEILMTAIDQSVSVDPPADLRRHFDAALQQEKATLAQQRGFAWWQVAAAVALLAVGFTIGKISAPDQTEQVIALQSQVDLLKEMATVNTLQTHTASERIKAVNMIEEEMPKASDQLVNTLVQTLNNDDSPNVRYAAAQALNRYIGQEKVRLALVASLERQTDPLIQLSLISMLVEAQEKTAIKPLRDLMKKQELNPEVKRQAEVALNILI